MHSLRKRCACEGAKAAKGKEHNPLPWLEQHSCFPGWRLHSARCIPGSSHQVPPNAELCSQPQVVPTGMSPGAHKKSWWENSVFSFQSNDEHVLSVLTERGSYSLYFPTLIFSFFIKNGAELTVALSRVSKDVVGGFREQGRQISVSSQLALTLP